VAHDFFAKSWKLFCKSACRGRRAACTNAADTATITGLAVALNPISEMKLSHKIRKLAQPLAYRRAWRRAQRIIFPLPVEPMLASIDRQRLREIQQRYAGSAADYAKYADVERWLRVNRKRVQDLKLHRSPPRRVLDLGCGGGFFLFILKRFDHSVLGLDMDQFPLFTELLDLFGVQRVVWTIKAFESLPDLGQKFDWITAFSINFNLHYPMEQLWGPEEWDFFLRDLQQHLAPGGKMFFALNPTFGRDYYTPELRDFFLSRGATVERERIFFEKGCTSS
jgi:2-polyprenyl-3-methyl-5-hydroxy-6-metoxy-1,4-benzoquinol methylase